jgi:DNA primase
MNSVAGFISDNLREQIRAASDIVDVIGGYIPLKRAGANFTALCPFHKEKTPSFNVNPQKQIFHCFGCHKGGDVFTFVKEYENIGFVDAMRRLAERAKIPLELDNVPGAQESRHLKDTLLQIHDQIAQRWQNCLANEAAGQAARDYLATRGVSEEAIKLFRLGAAPDSWDDTVNWATSKGHDLATVEKAGLIIRREGAEGFYDRFRGRLMFPICDEQGRVIGFSGRVLEPDAKTAKYVNSPETPIFTKSKVFFGLDKSKRAILDAGFAIVCEGQLDLIACFMGGVQNIVAPQGTAFTEQHARIIKRYVDEVVLCFDSDDAGQNAAVRSHDSLLSSGLAVRVAVVPAPHDPDSFIKANGGEAFHKLIEGADGFFDYFLNRLCAQKDVATDKGRLTVLRSMAESVQKTGNRVLLDKYAQKTALRLGVAPEAVRAEFNKTSGVRAAPGERFESEAEMSVEAEMEMPRPSGPELWLLKLVFKHETAMDWLVAHLDPEWIPHTVVRELVRRRLAAHTENSWRGLAAFLDGFESSETRSLLTEVTTEEREIPNPDQQLADITLRLRNQAIDRQFAALTHRSSQSETSPEYQLKLLREQQELRQLKRQPLVPLSPF